MSLQHLPARRAASKGWVLRPERLAPAYSSIPRFRATRLRCLPGHSRRLEMDRRVSSGAGADGDDRPRPPTRSSSRTSAAAATTPKSFMTRGEWTLRDLDSRNGTFVGERQIRGDYHAAAGRHRPHRQLAPGVRARSVAGVSRSDHRRAGPGQLPIGEETRRRRDRRRHRRDSTTPNVLDERTSRRRSRTAAGRRRFLVPGEAERRRRAAAGPGRGQALPAGVRAGQRARRRPRRAPGARRPVRRHAGRCRRRAAACRAATTAKLTPTDLEVVASRSDFEPHAIIALSSFLAATVLRDGEAVLARNVDGDSQLGSRDSKGEIHATSVDLRPDPAATARCWA